MQLAFRWIIAIAVSAPAARADDTTRPSPNGPIGDSNRVWWLPDSGGPRRDISNILSGTMTSPADALTSLPSISATVASTPPAFLDWAHRATDPWAAPILQPEGLQRVATSNLASDWADLSGKVKLRERDAYLDPAARNAWETDETVKVPVAKSVFFFNQMTGSTPAVEQQQYKWLNKAGVGLKLKPWLFQEVQVRTGPAVRYDDTSTLSKGQSPEHPELFLEAVTKLPMPVVGPLNVEYTSYAVPAATPADHNQINQDFKLALPIGGGQFHVGAKYKWEAANATPWMDRMQLYLGVQNKW
jgi:hypothetical protein